MGREIYYADEILVLFLKCELRKNRMLTGVLEERGDS